MSAEDTLTGAMFPTPAFAQIGSIWRKLEKEVEIILIFALMFLRFKKSNLLSSRFQDELITVLSLAIPFNFVSNNRIPLF